MNPFILWIPLLLFSSQAYPVERVRHVSVANDQIITVKTSIGIATIIQVPDRPNSIVVGDLESFKVEYLDQAITIKPLHPRARSNLYIYTDWRRYNVQLVTAQEIGADYVVYLDTPKERSREPKSTLVWTKLNRKTKSGNILFEVNRIGKTKEGMLLVEFTLSSTQKEKLDPSWFWITQNEITKPIHNLFLLSVELRPTEHVQGMIQILKSDLDETKPFKIELRRSKTSSVQLPKVTSWK